MCRATQGRPLHGVRPLLLAGLVLAAAAAGAANKPVVAVLPFRVHSAKPIEYLGESLANLLRTRLEAGGRVDVMDPEQVKAHLTESQLEETREGKLREIAAELGADYVLSASVTELAGRYSLDVRITPAASGLGSHTLVLTAEQDDELLARVDEVAEGVAEQVAGAAPALVAQVSVEGAGDLEPRLLGEITTRTGGPYDPAVAREDAARLRRDPEIASATVEAAHGAAGVDVHFKVVRADQLLPQPGRRASRDVVAEVRVRGNRRIETAAILARVATRPGSPYRPAQIARDVREVNSLGFFHNVRVFTEETPAGRVVTFEVEENPVVRQISISGNENVDGDKIRDILTITTGSTLDYPLLYENRERIAALYRAQGYYLSEVSYEIEPLSESSVGIHFIVDENKKLKLRNITFVGNQHFTSKQLTEGFQTKVWHFWSYATTWFDHSGTYSEPVFQQDLQTVLKKYADAGYLQADVGEPDVIPSPDGLDVTVHITEGPQFRVGKIEIAGDETVDVDKLKEKLLLKEGEVFNRSHLTDSVTVLTDYYMDRGFFHASVAPVSNLSDTKLDVDVTFQVRKGPLYFIREIDISGNTTTVDPVIRREVRVVEGQLYSQRQIMLSRLRIEHLGFFEEVDVNVEPTDAPEQLDLGIRVVERPTGSFSFGAGYSSQDGFIVNGSLQQSNLFGRGYAASASVDYGGSTQRFYLSLADPHFLGSDFSLGVTGYRTNLNYQSFTQESTGVELALGHALSEDGLTNGYLHYSYGSEKLTDDNRITAASMIFREIIGGSRDMSLTGLSLTSDHRNDRLSPSSGYNFAASIEGAGLLGFASFVRAESRVAWYLGAPSWMPERSTFVVATRLGYVLPFNSIGDFDLPQPGVDLPHDSSIRPLGQIDDNLTLPLSERYFLGGLGQFQLRGFKARTVGPRRPILYNPALASDPNLVLTGYYTPVGRQVVFRDPEDPNSEVLPGFPGAVLSTKCVDVDSTTFGDNNQICNGLNNKINDLHETDIIGGNKFISSSVEYRFPISDTLGLQGVVFFDTGNAFAENENLFDVTNWRYGTGAGVQWFSPFGPLALVLGFPIDKLSVESSPVFEFSVGGRDF